MGTSVAESPPAELFAEAPPQRLPLRDTPWSPPDWTDKFFGRQPDLWVQKHYPLIRQAQRDGIEHVAPILVALACDPAQAKKRVGRAVWRRIHQSPLELNVLRGNVVLRTRITLPDLIEFPKSALRDATKAAARYTTPAVIFAGRLATNRNQFREAAMLAHDAIGMEVSLNPKWSLKRLRREHDRKAMEIAERTTSDVPWQEPWTAEVDGYTVTLLRSARDFATEAMVQRHCIASYTASAREGQSYVMRIEGAERATVRYAASSLRVIEAKARYNAAVSKACHKACVEAGNLFKKNPAPVLLQGETHG